MKVYLVGGSVRDQLLGLEVKDRDYVVVGAQAQQLLDQGFTQVGADFPVFLHPQTKDEYALARSERKSGSGYHGFLVDTHNISLEQDLERRDLTINAMAQDADGTIIDPYGGRKDLEQRVLRHVGEAFEEDPVRVLRIGRFLARLGPQWSVAEQTKALIVKMHSKGELEHLTGERVWKELSRAVMEPHAHLCIDLFKELGLFESQSLKPYESMKYYDPKVWQNIVGVGAGLEARMSYLMSRDTNVQSISIVGKEIQQACAAYGQLEQVAKSANPLGTCLWVDVMQSCGYFKGNRALDHALHAWKVQSPLHQTMGEWVEQYLKAAMQVDIKAISAQMKPGPQVGQAQRQARIDALAALNLEPLGASWAQEGAVQMQTVKSVRSLKM